jgi:Ca-activated chloride channel family protein
MTELILLPFFVMAIILLIANYRKTKFFTENLMHKTHTKYMYKNFSQTRQLLKLIFSILALSFIFIAILRPQWNKKEQAIDQEGRDLLIMLDISRSMLAQDLKPNRIEFIKLKLKALLKKLTFERVGLILFSGSSFVQCPLTTDYSAFLMFLDQVDVESIASGTTAIDSALKKAIYTYKQYPGRKNKLALLVTDGEDFSLNLKPIQKEAQKENITIFALGAGTPDGAPIPKIDTYGKMVGHETDKNGNVELSKLNENLLKNICSELSGSYIRASHDDSDIDHIVSLINKFEKEKFGNEKLSLYQDQYPWFLGISWVFLALGWIL